jgi:hypothetical protein
MTDELKRRMARLREIAPRLNAATDDASKLVNQVEKFLVEELRIGVSAEVCYEELPAGTDEEHHEQRLRNCLAFGRCAGSFRIHVCKETIDTGGGTSAQTILQEERIPWPSCTREMKLKAFEKLPDLLDKIIEQAERLAQASEATRSKVDAMLGDEEPIEQPPERAGIAESGRGWSRQLAEAARKYIQREKDVVESELDGDAWEARMEAERREDADPHDEWQTAKEKLIRLVCIVTGHDPSEPLEQPIGALTDEWLLVVSPGREDPWDDEDADSRRLVVVPRRDSLTMIA